MALESFRGIVAKSLENGITLENVEVLVLDLERNNVEFLKFVQSVGPSLINDDKTIRLNATKLLSEVVSKLRLTYFSQNEVEVLAEFLCAKFADHHLIAPASLKGLALLAKVEAMSGSTVRYILRAIFKDLTVQTLIYTDRCYIYSIFDTFLKNRLEDLKEMNGEFIIGFVQAVDSERDPRNLLCTFELIPIIGANIPLGAMAEDLFELISEYFPIEFTPRPNNEMNITREDLSRALKPCFTASEQFADYSLPLIIENMSSDEINSKIDSLEYLASCCEAYPPQKIAKLSGRIWPVLRHNMFSSRPDMESSCLSALISMVRCLSKPSIEDDQDVEMKSSEDLVGFLDDILKDCSRYLQEPGLPIYHQSVKILLAASFASSQSSNILLGKVIDKLLSEFEIQKQVVPRVSIVRTLLTFIGSGKMPASSEKDNQEIDKSLVEKVTNEKLLDVTGILLERKEAIIGIFVHLRESQSSDLQSMSVWGMMTILSLEEFLNDEEQHAIMNHISHLSVTADSEIVKKSVLNCLEYVSLMKFNLCLEIVMPKLLERLHSVFEIYKSGRKEEINEKLKHMLLCLSHVSTVKEFVIESVNQLIQVVIDLCRLGDFNSDIISTSFHGLQHIITTNISGDSKDYFVKQFLNKCLDVTFEISKMYEINLPDVVENSNSATVNICPAIEGFAACIRLVIQKSDAELTRQFVNGFVNLFLDHINACNASKSSENPTKTFLNLLLSTACSTADLESVNSVEEIMKQCFHLAVNNENLNVISSKCLASLVNKTSKITFLDDFLIQMEVDLLPILSQNLSESASSDLPKQKRSCVVWSWLTKALVGRSHSRETLYANQMVDMLSISEISSTTSDGFRIVLKDYDDVLSKESHSNVTLFFKQRFFTFAIRRLVDSFHVCKTDLKKNYLNALSYFNMFVPTQAIQSELKLILPLLIQSLHQEEAVDVWLSSLSTLYSFIQSSPEEFSRHLKDVVPRLLELARHDRMSVRIESLKCISLIPERLSVSILLPIRKMCVLKLANCAGDHKRLVREQAYKANNAWHMLSQPQSEDD